MKIPLITTGKHYTFIGVAKTTVNKVNYPAIHYRISETNTKRITSDFINLTYKYYKEHNSTFPDRLWYENHELLKYEYKSRPCNYAVAQGLIFTILPKG